MFTWEDCPDCHGTGVNLDETAVEGENRSQLGGLSEKEA